MSISDQDVDRIAAAVVSKLTAQARGEIEIQREVRMSMDQRRELSRQRRELAKRGAA